MAKDKKKGAKKKVSFTELSDQELDKMYNEFKKEIQEIRFKIIASTYPNTSRISLLKRDIARILTVKNNRSMQAQAGK